MNSIAVTEPADVAPALPDSAVFDPASFAHMMQIARVLSEASLVPKPLQGKPSDCLLIVEQARRWGFSPFAVAQAAYSIGGRLGYEGKLVAAAVNVRAPIKAPLSYAFSGSGPDRTVTVSATIRGEDEPRTYSTTYARAFAAAGNSPLWKTDPDQQLAYYGARAWARRHCPEVILGVHTPDELSEERGPDRARDITPPPAAPQLVRWFDPDGAEMATTAAEAARQMLDILASGTPEEVAELVHGNETLPHTVTEALDAMRRLYDEAGRLHSVCATDKDWLSKYREVQGKTPDKRAFAQQNVTLLRDLHDAASNGLRAKLAAEIALAEVTASVEPAP